MDAMKTSRPWSEVAPNLWSNGLHEVSVSQTITGAWLYITRECGAPWPACGTEYPGLSREEGLLRAQREAEAV